MKIRLLAALLVIMGGQTTALAQVRPPASGGSKDSDFATQKTILYPSRNGTVIDDSVVRWYNTFFGTEPTENKLREPTPYLSYTIDGIRVYVGIDPQHPGASLPLKRTVFYWVLPTADKVEEKFQALKDQKEYENHFVGFLDKLRTVAKREDNNRTAAKEEVQRVREFIVKDPLGNEIGVINNPIYVPTR